MPRKKSDVGSTQEDATTKIMTPIPYLSNKLAQDVANSGLQVQLIVL